MNIKFVSFPKSLQTFKSSFCRGLAVEGTYLSYHPTSISDRPREVGIPFTDSKHIFASIITVSCRIGYDILVIYVLKCS